MKLNIQDIPICLINLPERKERLERTKLQLNSFYSCESYNLNLIEGVRHRQAMKGIATAHMNAIRLAKENNWEYVVVCEDDVHFQSIDSRIHADKCFENAPNDFDILLSGVYTSNTLKQYNECFVS